MQSNAAIIEKAEVRATKEIRDTWGSYQKIGAKLGLDFGRACYNWQQKFGGIKTQGQKGQGLRSKLIDLKIPYATAWHRMMEYKEAAGIVDVDIPDSPEEIRHEQVAAKIRQGLEDKSFPTLGVAWAPWKATTDADIAKYGTEPNNDRYRITLFLSEKQAGALKCPD